MLKQLLLPALLVSSLTASAQIDKTEEVKKLLTVDGKDTVAWTYGGVFTLGLNQGFLHNWPAGGELGSMTINGQFAGYATRIFHRHLWANNLDATYGLFYAYSNNFVPRKIDDRLDLTSKYGYQLDRKQRLFFSGLLNFRTQFTEGYDYSAPNWPEFSTSDFFSPAYLTGAIGLEYRNGNQYSLFFSPIASRFTFASRDYTTMSPAGAFGIEYGETSRYELGAYFSGRYTTEINQKLLFRTRLDLYANYLAKDKKDSLGNVVKKDNPGNIDILWDNFLSLKVNKWIGVNVGATFIYDNDIPYVGTKLDEASGQEVSKDEPGEGLGWWQVKQILSIGFEYRF